MVQTKTRASLWVAALAAAALGATGVAAAPAQAAGRSTGAVAQAHKIASTYVKAIATNKTTYAVGERINGYVTLNRAAGPHGITGKVTSNIPGLIAGGSLSGTLPAGFRSGLGFSLDTSHVKGPVTGTITVTVGGHSVSRRVTINNVFVVFLSTDRTDYAVGERINGYVTLNGTASSHGISGRLTSTIPGLIPGGSITGTFPAGFHSGPGFSLDTSHVKGPVTGTITATIGGHSVTTTVTID